MTGDRRVELGQMLRAVAALESWQRDDSYTGRGEELDAINEEIEAHRLRIRELGERRDKPVP